VKLTSLLIVAAAIFVFVSVLSLTVGLFERGVIRAQRQIATGNYDEAERVLDASETLFDYASLVPGVGRGPINALRTRQATVDYWQRDWDSLIGNRAAGRPVAPADEEVVQLLVANAIHRRGQEQLRGRDQALRALDTSIAAYANVLKRGTESAGAAYNYELLLRLRAAMQERRKPVPPDIENGQFGRGGSPMLEEPSDAVDFKTYVPLESEERRKGAEAGKTAAKARKG
jgi:hypothetical protein